MDFCALGVAGQLLEVRATLSHDATTMESPVLYDLTVTVNDTEPPVVLAVPTNNPSGGGSPNPSAGFYQLTGTDNCGAVQIYIKDTVSGAVFGPFASGIKVKLTQAPGPSSRACSSLDLEADGLGSAAPNLKS